MGGPSGDSAGPPAEYNSQCHGPGGQLPPVLAGEQAGTTFLPWTGCSDKPARPCRAGREQNTSRERSPGDATEPNPSPCPPAGLAGRPAAALGCSDEAGLGYEPVEAIGPELPEGVSVGPGGVITIDKGLAADEGNPLADRGGFECDDIPDCWDKCKLHCYCEPTESGFCCCNGGDLTCEYCSGGGGDECGEGVGEVDEDEEEEEGPGVSIGLSCREATRGSYTACRVMTGTYDPDSLRFDWYSGDSKWPDYSETGRSGMTWGGYATKTRTITLELKRHGGTRHGRRVWRGSTTVRVHARDWSLETQDARPVDRDLGYHIWGRYERIIPKRSDLRVVQGNGPWAGSYYLSGSPKVWGTAMYIHSDLASGGPTHPIPASDTICGVIGGSNVRRGVHSLNKTCNIVGRLDGFRGEVVYDENRHQNSLNDCIRVVNRRLMSHVEEATGSQLHVNNVLENTWYTVADDLRDAVRTLQITRTSNGKVRYYPGHWKYGVATAVGHGDGRNGC